jgi:tryptophan-rich sensory protein
MWIHDPRPWDFRGWVPLFFTHLLVQVGWLILLFAYNVVFVAMLMAFVLATYVFILTAAAWERSKIAFWLLLVYLAWTLYALGMNIAVWGVN